MPYISLSKAELKAKKTAPEEPAMHQVEKQKKIFRHPVRNRIVGILRDGKPRTQQEIGNLLSMSNAAVHYHLKLLKEIGIITLHDTRQGPKGITEKLYTADVENWPDITDADLEYYLSYMTSWMNERNREGLNLLKSGDITIPFLTGSYSTAASREDLLAFKRKMEALFNEFYEKCEKSKQKDRIQFAVTFSMVPSREKNTEDSRNVLEFEPEVSATE